MWLTLLVDLQSAADRLGVHYQTAYRWVRDGSLPAVKHGAVYDIEEADLVRFQEQRKTPAPPPKQATVRSWQHQVERLYALLVEGDELDARQLLDRLREGMIEPLVLCEELFAPTLRAIGDAWADGRISVAVEHRASAICERLVARLSVHPRGRPRGVCLVTTPPGEQHGLPAAMAALVLRADRWQVHHLGTEVPTVDLIEMARHLSATLVVLSTTEPEVASGAKSTADQVRAGCSAHVLVGAPGMSLRDLVALARFVG